MRTDVAALTEDGNAKDMPFVVGKITPTYNGYTRWVQTLRAGQDRVARETPLVYTVETEDLPVVDMKTHETLGSDVCHFNAGDMYTLGQRFAVSATEKHNVPFLPDDGTEEERPPEEQPPEAPSDGESEEKGCASSIGIGAVSAGVLLIASAALIACKKRKEN